MTALTLAQTQHLLWRLITAPSGVADGLRALGDIGGGLPDGLESVVNGDPRLSAVRRLDIYANMYFFRLLDAIKQDFPTAVAVVGPDAFHNLITDYLLAHPPTHPSLRYAHQHLPGFVSEHRLSADYPFVPDLVKFEWALVNTFDAADAPVIDPTAFAAIAPEAWPTLRLTLTPSLQLLPLDWAVLEPWQRVQNGTQPGAATFRSTRVRTWRRDMRVLHREVPAEEFATLTAAARGEPFGVLCETMAAHVGADHAAVRAADLLQHWFTDGLIVGFDPS